MPAPAVAPGLGGMPKAGSGTSGNENVGGMQVTAPFIGGFKLAGSGSDCHAIFRIVDGRVAELHFTGDNDALGKEGVCAPIVRGCLRAYEPAAAQDDSAAAQIDSSTLPP